jgi:hypothetical protein
MATTLISTGIQFPDSSIQTTSAGSVTSVGTSGGLTGGAITTTGTLSIDTNNTGGIGAYSIAKVVSGSVASASTISGSSLKGAFGGNSDQGNGWVAGSDQPTLSGTWRNVTLVTLAFSEYSGAQGGIFIRTA